MRVLDDNGNDVTERYTLVSTRNVRALMSGIESMKRENVHFTDLQAIKARNTRLAGRLDAVSTLQLEV